MCVGKRNLLRVASLVPIWLLMLLLKPFLPDHHPWRHQSLTLKFWLERGTNNAIQFGVTLWVLGLCQIAMFIRLYVLCQK